MEFILIMGLQFLKKLSWPVEQYIININKQYAHLACAGTDDRRYYLAIPVGDSITPNVILMYDTEVAQWYVQEFKNTELNPNGEVLQFIRYKDEMYYTNAKTVFKSTLNFDGGLGGIGRQNRSQTLIRHVELIGNGYIIWFTNPFYIKRISRFI